MWSKHNLSQQTVWLMIFAATKLNRITRRVDGLTNLELVRGGCRKAPITKLINNWKVSTILVLFTIIIGYLNRFKKRSNFKGSNRSYQPAITKLAATGLTRAELDRA